MIFHCFCITKVKKGIFNISTIKNYLIEKGEVQEGSHCGQGPMTLYEIWEKSDFKSKVDFIDRMVVPPQSSIGLH